VDAYDFPSNTYHEFAVTPVKYRRDIDGLRAVAVLLVIVFHGFPGAIPGGFIGVDIFFVISGYLITGIIVRELELGTFSIANFYVRRVRRIFPALLTILLATVTLGWFFFLPNELISLGRNVYAGALFGPNLMLLSEVGYFDTAAQLKPLLHLWSLGIEEQFYAAFPLFLIFLSSRKYNLLGGIAGLAIVSFLLNVMLVKTNSAATFYLPFTRAWELMIGAILALPKLSWALRERFAFDADIRAIVGAILIGIGAVSLDSRMPYPGWAALLPGLGTALLIAAQAAFLNSVVLSNQVLVFVGLISYPIYLWHWPLLSFFEVLSDEPTTPIFRGAVLVASVVLAYLTYRFIELPLRTGGSRLMKAACLSAAMGLVCMFGVIIVNGQGFPSRLTAAIGNAGILEPGFAGLRRNSCLLLDPNTQTTFPDDCVEPGTAPLLLLWGDSTAGALAPGFRQLQQTYKFRLGQFATSACWPIMDLDVKVTPRCREVNDGVFSIVRKSKPDIVVLEGIWSTAFEAIGNTVAKLKSLNIPRVVVLGRVPVWNSDLPTSFLKFYLLHHEVMPVRLSRSHVDSDWTDAAIRRYVEPAGGEFISTYSALCDETACLTRAGDSSPDIIVSDRIHLTDAGSIFVVGKIAEQVFHGIISRKEQLR